MSLSGSQTVRCVALCHCAVQIYVEVERAHLTLELAKMKEEEGDIEEAARVLQELQVSMSRSGSGVRMCGGES